MLGQINDQRILEDQDDDEDQEVVDLEEEENYFLDQLMTFFFPYFFRFVKNVFLCVIFDVEKALFEI